MIGPVGCADSPQEHASQVTTESELLVCAHDSGLPPRLLLSSTAGSELAYNVMNCVHIVLHIQSARSCEQQLCM